VKTWKKGTSSRALSLQLGWKAKTQKKKKKYLKLNFKEKLPEMWLKERSWARNSQYEQS
jgi:hypothetical protein